MRNRQYFFRTETRGDEADGLLENPKNPGFSWPLGAYDVALECERVSLNVGKLQILRDCNLAAVADGVTAFLGPSGAGKSSLLDVLAGRRTSGKSQGTVFLGGVVVSATQRRTYSSYVAQDDVLPMQLTAMDRATRD